MNIGQVKCCNHGHRMLLLLLCIGLLAGCTTTKSAEKKVITILYSSLSEFKLDYANALQAKFDNIDFEIVEYSSLLGDGTWNGLEYLSSAGKEWDAEQFVALVKEKTPDIIYFPTMIYPQLLEANLLKDVTDYASQYDFAEIEPPIMESLQRMGEGRLYFLSDSLASRVVYYNKALFEQYNVALPHDFMSWEELITSANMISERGEEDEVIGLAHPDYSVVEMLLLAGKSNGLTWYNIGDASSSFADDAWKSALEILIEQYKWESRLPITNKRYTDLFQENKVAMVLDSYLLKDELDRTNKAIDWDIVTAPVIGNEPDQSYSISFQYLNGIHTATPHSKEVLEVWAHLNGKDVARKKHNMNFYRNIIPVRSNVLKDDGLQNVAAFYQLGLPASPLTKEEQLPREVENRIKRYLYEQMGEIVAGQLTIEEAVSNWDAEIAAIILDGRE